VREGVAPVRMNVLMMLLRLVGHCVCLLRQLLAEDRGGKGLGG
jgi:hypothetical protein